MKKAAVSILTYFCFISSSFAQVNVFGSLDLAYDFPDKLLTDHLARKITLGLWFSNDPKTYVAYIGGWFKGFKFQAYNPNFTQAFKNDVKLNYIPVAAFGSKDSVVGASMYNIANDKSGYFLWGHYGLHLHTGAVFTASKLKPSIDFYIGGSEYVFYSGLVNETDPLWGYDWISMGTSFYEVKLGVNVLYVNNFYDFPGSLNLNIGYKRVNYGDISFNGVPLSRYTANNLADKYKSGGKLTLSLCYSMWRID